MKVDALANLKRVDENIAALQKIMKTNEHNAAGIQLELGVGANPTPERMVVMHFGIASDVDGLFAKMLDCLVDSRSYWTRSLGDEIKAGISLSDGPWRNLFHLHCAISIKTKRTPTR